MLVPKNGIIMYKSTKYANDLQCTIYTSNYITSMNKVEELGEN